MSHAAIDEVLAAVFTAAWQEAAGSPASERLPEALAAVRKYLGFGVAQRVGRARQAHRADRRSDLIARRALPFLERLASAYGFRAADLVGQSRHAEISLVRHYAAWVMRRVEKRSYPAIGAALGGRDHSTMISAVRRVDALVAADETLGARLRALAVAPAAAGERAA